MASSSLRQSALSFPSEAYVSLPRSPPVSLSPSLFFFFSFLSLSLSLLLPQNLRARVLCEKVWPEAEWGSTLTGPRRSASRRYHGR